MNRNQIAQCPVAQPGKLFSRNTVSSQFEAELDLSARIIHKKIHRRDRRDENQTYKNKDRNSVVRNVVQSELNRQGAKDAKEKLGALGALAVPTERRTCCSPRSLRLCGSIFNE